MNTLHSTVNTCSCLCAYLVLFAVFSVNTFSPLFKAVRFISANLSITIPWCIARISRVVTSIAVSWVALVRTGSWWWVRRWAKGESISYNMLSYSYWCNVITDCMAYSCSSLCCRIHVYSLVDKELQVIVWIICSGAAYNMILLHSLALTHLCCSSSRTVPEGHWHPCTHCRVQKSGCGLLHTGGHDVPHVVYTWPSIVHSTIRER